MSTVLSTGIVVVALAVAALFCMARVRQSSPDLNYRLLHPTWDFNKSWASDFVGVGSILGVALGVSKGLAQADLGATVTLLSVFFGVLVLLAPITFLALGVADAGTPPGSAIDGTLRGFFVASGLTLWATIGVVLSAAALFVDVGKSLSWPVVILFLAVSALALVVLLSYAWLSMGAVVKAAVQHLPPGDLAYQAPKAWSLL